VRNRRLGLISLLAADGISRAGNAVTVVAVPLYVLMTTQSALAAGIVGVFATVPIVIGGALGGVLVDRLGWRASSILADLASGVTVLAIPVLAGFDLLPFWLLVTLVFLSGLLDVPGSTARISLMPDLVERAGMRLSRATGAHATVQRSATLLGAGGAGLLIAVAGPAEALYVNAACFALSALVTAVGIPRILHRSTEPAPSDDETDATGGYWRTLASGFRYVAQQPLVRAIVLLVVVTNAIDAAGMTVLKPVYATSVDPDGAFLGAMLACFAGGALLGAACYSAVGHGLRQRRLLIVTFFVAGVSPYAAMALGIPDVALLVVIAVAGFAAGPINPILDTALLALLPAGLRARVFGAIAAGVAAAMPLGALLAGVGVETWGLLPCLIVAAVLYAIATLSTVFVRDWRRLDDPPRDAQAESAIARDVGTTSASAQGA